MKRYWNPLTLMVIVALVLGLGVMAWDKGREENEMVELEERNDLGGQRDAQQRRVADLEYAMAKLPPGGELEVAKRTLSKEEKKLEEIEGELDALDK